MVSDDEYSSRKLVELRTLIIHGFENDRRYVK